MTENNKRYTPFPSDDRRTEYIGAKVTAEQKRHIRRTADKCDMTVSDYLLARAYGKAGGDHGDPCRLPQRPRKYTSALRGMSPEKRRQMFGNYPFMLGWLKELGKLAERITDVLDKARLSNRLPAGTRNDDDGEEEP